MFASLKMSYFDSDEMTVWKKGNTWAKYFQFTYEY